MGFSCVSPSTSAGRARGTSEQTSEQGLVLAVTKWLISSIQELKKLPKQKSRPRRSNYTWGGGGRGEEEKKTSITEPLPHETQQGLGGTWRRRGLSRAGCKHTPDPCPHLAIPVGEHWPVLSPWAPANVENLLCISYWIPGMGPAGAPFSCWLSPPRQSGCAAFSLPAGEFRPGHGSMDVSCTLAAATGVGNTKVREKQRAKSHAEQIIMHK